MILKCLKQLFGFGLSFFINDYFAYPLILSVFQYILTAGMDSNVKLWELSTNRCLIGYTGAGATGVQEYAINASFNHNEDFGGRSFVLGVL